MQEQTDFKEFLIFIDDSNLWISGQRYQGDKLIDADTDPRFRVDLGKLLHVLTGPRGNISRAFLYGSVPPPNDTVWRAAKKKNYDVQTYKRSTVSGKEKEVDVAMTTDIMEMLYTQEDDNATFIIVTGDRDLKMPMEKVLKKSITVILWSWEKSLSVEYRRMANEHKPLFKVQKLDEAEHQFSYKSYEVSKNYKINPSHALVFRNIANNKKSYHTVADCISQFMMFFYIIRKIPFPSSDTQDLIVEYPNTDIDVILPKLEKTRFEHKPSTYAQYVSSSDTATKSIETVNRFQAETSIQDECLLDIVESDLGLILDQEENGETCSITSPEKDEKTNEACNQSEATNIQYYQWRPK